MLPDLPILKILPVQDLVLHEDHDLQRTLPLVEKLRAQGILRNPPIVMPLQDGSGRYMVLDGANRVTSLRSMDFPHIVAQVVAADDPHVSLMTWNHVVWGLRPGALLTALRRVEGLQVQRIRPERSVNAPDCTPLLLRLADGRLYMACAGPDADHQNRILHAVVGTYKDRAGFDRTSQTLVDAFADIHPDLTGLVIFPRFDIPTLLQMCARGQVLPTGITRFTVSPRVLHLNYPLHELSSARPLAEKQAYLTRWVQERLLARGIRYYAEATFLFDE